MTSTRKLPTIALAMVLTYMTAPSAPGNAGFYSVHTQPTTGGFYSVHSQPMTGGFYSVRTQPVPFWQRPLATPAPFAPCMPLPCGVPTCSPDGYPINYYLDPCMTKPRFPPLPVLRPQSLPPISYSPTYPTYSY